MTIAYICSIDSLYHTENSWEYGLLKETFSKNNIEEISILQKFDIIPKTERAFVVITGTDYAKKEKILSKQLKNIKRVVLFVIGDECALFNPEEIDHTNISIWIQYPHPKHKQYNKFFLGTPIHMKNNLPNYPIKQYNIYFGGQINNQRREQLAKVMPILPNSIYKPTKGFAQGEKPKDYYKNLSSAKISPCPAGSSVIDTFRFFESIEMLTLPVGDLIGCDGKKFDYFNFIFPENVPINKLSNWAEINNLMPELIKNYPNNMHQVVCWWLKYKRDFSINIMKDLYEQK